MPVRKLWLTVASMSIVASSAVCLTACSSTKTTQPAAMPMPARPKPAHQPTVWPSRPHSTAAQNAPRLMP